MIDQKQKLKMLFERNAGQWIPLFEIMKIGAQYNARIHELRNDGMVIKNRTKMVEGVKHSWYMYIPFQYNKQNQAEFITNDTFNLACSQ